MDKYYKWFDTQCKITHLWKVTEIGCVHINCTYPLINTTSRVYLGDETERQYELTTKEEFEKEKEFALVAINRI